MLVIDSINSSDFDANIQYKTVYMLYSETRHSGTCNDYRKNLLRSNLYRKFIKSYHLTTSL